MIDVYPEIQRELVKIMPTYYEGRLTGATGVPCYTVQSYANMDTEPGETVGYSTVSYMVKTWAKSHETVSLRKRQADDAMRRLGFHRNSSQELIYGDIICNLAVYEAQAYERYYTDTPL